MTEPARPPADGARIYWLTWAALLALTLIMLIVDAAPLARPLLAGLLLAAMLVKISLIAGVYMHLREAHPALVITFVGGLLFTGLLLYAAIVPDALRVHGMGAGR